VERDELLADCQARLGFDLLANTWSAVVIFALRDGPQRHGVLRERIGGISAKVLTETLRRLEYNGMVVRHERAGGPPRVDYSLTDLGTSLLDPILAIARWSFDHADDVLAAQDRADALTASAERSNANAGWDHWTTPGPRHVHPDHRPG
jgi:DNA-binding HxlR family transcriptional regulator